MSDVFISPLHTLSDLVSPDSDTERHEKGRPGERRYKARGDRLIAAVEGCPCDTCQHQAHCAATGHECRAYREYYDGLRRGTDKTGRTTRNHALPGEWFPEWRTIDE